MRNRVVTFGTFDLFHIGHLMLLQRAASYGDLVVGVSTDSLTFDKKQRRPVHPEHHRLEIVRALSCVSDVFYEHSLDRKRQYLREHAADVLIMGDDWRGRFDEFVDVCEVVYLERTPSISTTATIEAISTSVEVATSAPAHHGSV